MSKRHEKKRARSVRAAPRRAVVPTTPCIDDRTPEGRAAILQRMRDAATRFYAAAIAAGCHAFIEFAGLMNEFIGICQQAEDQGRPWVHASVHGETHLPFAAHNIDYLNEKLACIYGLRIAPVPRRDSSSANSPSNKRLANDTLDQQIRADLEHWTSANRDRPVQILRGRTSDVLLEAYEDALNALVRLRQRTEETGRRQRSPRADLKAAVHLARRLRQRITDQDTRARDAFLDAASDAGALHSDDPPGTSP